MSAELRVTLEHCQVWPPQKNNKGNKGTLRMSKIILLFFFGLNPVRAYS